MADGHSDTKVFELLSYGFPLDLGPVSEVINHSSAEKFPDQVGKYIKDELDYEALKRANTSNFNFLHKSSLMSRPKDGDKHRVILDLSWPKNSGALVNKLIKHQLQSILDSCIYIRLLSWSAYL
jgi:hypothetical protein